MHDSLRNGSLALGLALGVSLAFNAIGLLSVGSGWIGLEKARTDTSNYAQQQCARQQAEHAAHQPAILNGDQTAPPEISSNDADRGKDNEPDWCDLAAQQSMADSTVGVMQTAWLTVGLTVIAIFLLWRTLFYTRETLKEAGDATEAANRAANAAGEAVKVTSDIAKRQLRAFVFGKGFNQGLSIWDGAIRDYIVFVNWENTGLTPATDVRGWIKFETFPMIEKKEVTFTKTEIATPTVLGPHSSIQSSYITIPLQTVMEKWQGQTEILVWSRIEYRDTFDPSVVHHHEQCAVLNVIHDPSDIPPKDHPSYVSFSVCGPQNTSS